MSDRTAIRVGMAGAVLVAICCAAPLIAVGLSFAGLGAWLAGKGLVVLPLMAASFGLIAWIFHLATQRPPVARRRFTRKA